MQRDNNEGEGQVATYKHYTFRVMIILILLLDWRQYGNSLALCYFAVVMELPDSLWMNCKSEFGVIFLMCSQR